uniref:Uncharacterized protein LOC8273873 isoform X2 n=1 Tax=Rhizophora mucronata TaxID=61149 RepID=A0A2P2J8G4_RHIMU
MASQTFYLKTWLLLEHTGGWTPGDPIPHRTRSVCQDNQFCYPNTRTCHGVHGAACWLSPSPLLGFSGMRKRTHLWKLERKEGKAMQLKQCRSRE